MGYYFECPNCNNVTPVSPDSVLNETLELSCDDCNEDICPECIYDGRCLRCFNSLEPDE